MTDREVVSLREYIETLIENERQLRDAQNRATSEALRIQAEEYGRRLHDLNGEASRLREIQSNYVPRETYEAYLKEQSAVQQGLAKALDDTRERLEKATKDTTDRLEKSVSEIRLGEAGRSGRGVGLNAGWLYLLGFVATVGPIVAIFVSLSH
jgi:hypothetical protein